MARSRNSGFTLMEVMLAVAILSLTAAAALKLVVLSQNSLRAAKASEEFLMTAEKVRSKILAGELSENGKEGDLRWSTSEKQKEFFTADFGKLDFSRKTDEIKADANFRWRELELEDRKIKKKMKIVLPWAEQANNGNNDLTQ